MPWRLRWFGLMILVVGCTRSAPPVPPPASDATATPPKLVKPLKKTVRRVVDQPAQNVEAFQHAPLHARIAGYVHKLHVDIGDPVKAGQVLVELSVPELDVELKQKDAMLLQAEAEVKLARSSLVAAEASLKSAAAQVKQAESGRARALAEHKRTQSQHERLEKISGTVINPESISEARFALDAARAMQDEVEAKVLSMQAQREEAQAKRDKASADVEVMQARRDVARSTRDMMKEMREYANIKAPFDGVVTRRYVDVGHFVQPATAASKGEPLVSIDRRDKMRVFVLVPELEALWMNGLMGEKTALEARIYGEGLGGRVLKGTVARSAFALDARSRTLRTEVDLDNQEGLLRPGMYVYVSIPLERRDVWTLPVSCVRKAEGMVNAYRLVDGKPKAVPLMVGLEGGGVIEVLKKQAASSEGWEDVTGEEEFLATPGGA